MVPTRQRVRFSVHLLCGALLAAAIAGCGGTAAGGTTAGGGASAGGSTTLNTAYYGDPSGGIDPDVFYDVEGDSIMLAVYNTLGDLRARDYEHRPGPRDGLEESARTEGRYTFQLRHGVKFHDGTPFNAQAVKINFERRIKLKQAVSYTDGGRRQHGHSAPYTFVVHLTKRNNAFLDLHGVDVRTKDRQPRGAACCMPARTTRMKWLSSHEDGTGPYALSAYSTGQPVRPQSSTATGVLSRTSAGSSSTSYPTCRPPSWNCGPGASTCCLTGMAESELQGLKSAG